MGWAAPSYRLSGSRSATLGLLPMGVWQGVILMLTTSGVTAAAPSCAGTREPVPVKCFATDALRASAYADMRRVRCHLSSGVARLEGQLPSFYLKQAAQEIVRKLEGVERVDNRIIVHKFD
jgi:osmotically-inducible protein OsmY